MAALPRTSLRLEKSSDILNQEVIDDEKEKWIGIE
jgi:hypothetical protein